MLATFLVTVVLWPAEAAAPLPAAPAPAPIGQPARGPSFTVALSASPGGRVSGGGTAAGGSTESVSAIADRGYVFSEWREGGRVVSTAPNYSFTVTGNHTLTAVFTPAPVVVAPPPRRGGDPVVVVEAPPASRRGDPVVVVETPPAPRRGEPVVVVETPPAPRRGPEVVVVASPPPPKRELRIVVGADPSAPPRFQVGPGREEFVYVRRAPEGRIIESRDGLQELLLRREEHAFVWGLGDVATLELAVALGLPLHTPLYAMDAGVPVVSAVPPGYFVAEYLPTDGALITNSQQGPVVLVPQLPPGSAIAYYPSPTGEILGECVVVPPVQPVVMMAAPPPPPASNSGQIVYDANHQPIGVIITDANGQQSFVPLQH